MIRLLNTVANDIYQQFSDGYIGVVNNNEQGRMMFKSAIVGYLLDIQPITAFRTLRPRT